MRGVITAPTQIITGGFTLLFSFPMDVELRRTDMLVETLEGDALGCEKDAFGGSGKHYHFLCYIPDARFGRSRFSIVKDGLDVEPVIIEYDTVKMISATWGTPILRGRTLEVPVVFSLPIRRLRKRNFRVSYPTQCQLYGSGEAYTLVIPNPRNNFRVTVSGGVQKASGLRAEIETAVLEVSV